MTHLATGALPATAAPSWVSHAGVVCLAAGLLGAASGIFLAVYAGQVSEEMFSYPLTPGGFTVIQIWFFVQHLGLLAGIAALAGAETMSQSRTARWGTGLAVTVFAVALLAEPGSRER